jgi:tyrosine phenol-lyase
MARLDHLTGLYRYRQLVGGLEWEKEPKVLRFFVGRLKAKGDWPQRLMAKFRADFGDSL